MEKDKETIKNLKNYNEELKTKIKSLNGYVDYLQGKLNNIVCNNCGCPKQ